MSTTPGPNPDLGAPGDPFDPLSFGQHRTDTGLRYAARPDADPSAMLESLFRGRGADGVDVTGCCFAFGSPAGVGPSAWPGVVIDLNLAIRETSIVDGELHFGRDYLPEALAARGLHRVDRVNVAPDVDTVRWTVQLRDGRRYRSGIYGPGHGDTPRGWTALSPMPPCPPDWQALLPDTGGQCGVYVSSYTRALAYLSDDAFVAGLKAACAAGQMFGTRAVVTG